VTDPRPLHPLLRQRWSPQDFRTDHELDATDVATLLEAARWAPSAGNSQPWAFVAARRADETHRRLVPHLLGGARRWGVRASLLLVNLCHRTIDETDYEYSEFAMYDLGQAVAHLTIQAESMGLSVRQFRSFDRDAVEALLTVAPGWQVATMAAIGVPPQAPAPYAVQLPDGRTLPRERRPLDEVARNATEESVDPRGRESR
jgi:nitroreductase